VSLKFQTTTKYIKHINTQTTNKQTCGLAMYEDTPSFLLSKSRSFHLRCSWRDEFYQRTAIQSVNLH